MSKTITYWKFKIRWSANI